MRVASAQASRLSRQLLLVFCSSSISISKQASLHRSPSLTMLFHLAAHLTERISAPYEHSQYYVCHLGSSCRNSWTPLRGCDQICSHAQRFKCSRRPMWLCSRPTSLSASLSKRVMWLYNESLQGQKRRKVSHRRSICLIKIIQILTMVQVELNRISSKVLYLP